MTERYKDIKYNNIENKKVDRMMNDEWIDLYRETKREIK